MAVTQMKIMGICLQDLILVLLEVVLVSFVVAVCGENNSSALIVNSANQTQIIISWTPATFTGLKVNSYDVKAVPIKWYSTNHVAMEMYLSLPRATLQAYLAHLQPGTKYNISVSASTEKGPTDTVSKIVWTEVGEPESPSPVEIASRNGSTMDVILHEAKSENGPVTGIQVVVLQKTEIVSFNKEQLFDYARAENIGMPFYVAAFLTPDLFVPKFTVGDGLMYGGYFNAPLKEGASYEVLEGVVSSLNGVTKTAYSSFMKDVLHFDVNHGAEEFASDESGLTTVLAIAVGVFGFLLVLSILLYFLLRRRYAKRRPSDELVLNDHITEGEENGCIPGLVQLGAEANLGDFWELLKERYPVIPRNFLEVSNVILGNGRFGEVRAGKVFRHGRATSVLVQLIHDHNGGPENERRALYSEMDAQLRLGPHEHIVEFLGLCEEGDILHLVGEHYDSTLRGMLLRGRRIEEGTVCGLSEGILLNLAVKLAEGMKYLTDHGIVHKHLSTRSIVVVDGYLPKIANFGLFFYNPIGKKLDFSRWYAPEVLKSHIYTTKADVWSFGVLLWEICTLGGTPFAEVPTREVYPRVVRGLRLQHPCGTSEEFYQLMLQCWELDADERPTFLDLCTVLRNMSDCAEEHLRFDRTTGFRFQKFIPNADEL